MDVDGMVVRLAELTDLLAIRELLRVECERRTDGTGFFHNINFIEQSQSQNNLYCIKDEASKPLAFCMTEQDGYTPCLLWVTETHQRRGYGRRLVDFCIEKAKRQGACGLMIHALRQSVEFWERLGFDPINIRYHYLANGDKYMRLLFPAKELPCLTGRAVVVHLKLFQGDRHDKEEIALAMASIPARYLPRQTCVFFEREWIVAFPELDDQAWLQGDDELWVQVEFEGHRRLDGVWYKGRAKYLVDFNGRGFGADFPLKSVFRMTHLILTCGWQCYCNCCYRKLQV